MTTQSVILRENGDIEIEAAGDVGITASGDLVAAKWITADELAACAAEKVTYALIVGPKSYPEAVQGMIRAGGKSGRLGRPE